MSPSYLAGFFDGEGCIDAQRMYPKQDGRRRFYCRPRVRVAMANSGRLAVEMLQAQYGGHLVERKSQNPRQQPSVSWELLNKEDILRILEVMTPHLVLKREQAKLAKWWLLNASGRQTSQGYPRLEDARRLFADELKLMKLDPQRLSEEAAARIELLMR